MTRYWYVLILGLLAVACIPVPSSGGTSATQPEVAPAIVASPSVVGGACRAQANGALPDPACTPGATDPRVTQDTIATTICQPGYTATVRPNLAAVKRERFAAYGVPVSAVTLSEYELDHLIPLEVGGASSSIANLWPEPWNGLSGAHAKDPLENRLHALVCSGALPLADAQTCIRTNWIECAKVH